MSRHAQFGYLIFSFTVLLPALAHWEKGNIFGMVWPLWLYFVVAAVGGAVSGALIADEEHRVPGAVCGLIAGPCAFFTHEVYASFRASLWNMESFLVGMVGTLPAIGIYRLWKHFREQNSQATEVRQPAGLPMTVPSTKKSAAETETNP